MKGHEAVASVLAEEGVETVFGVLGEANMLIVDDFVRHHGGRYVNNPREDGAVLAAMGFAHGSGRIGVATVTHGPAFTNASTALVEAVRNDVPLLLIAGDTPADTAGELQDIDQEAVTQPTGAGFEPVRSAASAIDDVRFAVRRATEERRPVVVNVPADLLDARVEPTPSPATVAPHLREPSPAALDAAVGIIASCARPIVLAGRGAVEAGARDELLALADQIGAPVATTLRAKGLFRGTPYDLGIFGTLSSVLTGDIIAEADCVIAFGASLNRFTAGHGTLLDGKRLVQIDADPLRIGRWFPADSGVVADAKLAAVAMRSWFDQLGQPPARFRSPELTSRLSAYRPSWEFEDTSGDGTVDLRTVTVLLDAVLPTDRNVVTDVGRYVMAPLRFLQVPEPRAALAPLGFGAVGMGLGAAIGMAVARPSAPTIAAIGDGGLMMSLAEFNTAVRYGLDLIVVVYNDGSYSAEYHNFRQLDLDPGLSLLSWPELAPLAVALGGHGVTVRTLADVDRVSEVIATRDRPVLIDVKVDPSVRIGFYD